MFTVKIHIEGDETGSSKRQGEDYSQSPFEFPRNAAYRLCLSFSLCRGRLLERVVHAAFRTAAEPAGEVDSACGEVLVQAKTQISRLHGGGQRNGDLWSRGSRDV